MLKLLLVIILLLGTINFIYDLFTDTLSTIKWICVIISFGIVICGIVWMHLKLKQKKHIEWEKYPELATLCEWICFSSWWSLSFGVIFFIIYLIDNTLLSSSIILLISSAFSFWTYFSLMLATKNGLFLLRSYLLSMLTLCIYNYLKSVQEPFEINLNVFFDRNYLYEAIGYIFSGLTAALFIKGLIMSLQPKVNDLFKDYHISYLNIAIVTIMIIIMIRMVNTTIIFNHI